jgi:hypothetical protein
MSDWSARNTDYGREYDVFPCDSETRMKVEYHEKYDLFIFETTQYPDHLEGRHEETILRISMCGRNLQTLIGFLQENCQRQGFWAEDSNTNDEECGLMRCARTKGHPGSHLSAEEWRTASKPIDVELLDSNMAAE